MSVRTQRLAMSGILVLVCLGFCYGAFTIPTFEADMTQVAGPATFPKIISIFCLICALGNLRHELRQPEQERSAKDTIGAQQMVLLLALVAYIALLPVIHFIPATLIFVTGLAVYLTPSGKKKMGVLVGAASAVIMTAVFYWIFAVSLNVFLP